MVEELENNIMGSGKNPGTMALCANDSPRLKCKIRARRQDDATTLRTCSWARQLPAPLYFPRVDCDGHGQADCPIVCRCSTDVVRVSFRALSTNEIKQGRRSEYSANATDFY